MSARLAGSSAAPCSGTAALNQKAEKVAKEPRITHDKVGSRETLASANEVLGVPPKAPAKAELHDKNVKSETQCHAYVFGSDMAFELENYHIRTYIWLQQPVTLAQTLLPSDSYIHYVTLSHSGAYCIGYSGPYGPYIVGTWEGRLISNIYVYANNTYKYFRHAWSLLNPTEGLQA